MNAITLFCIGYDELICCTYVPKLLVDEELFNVGYIQAGNHGACLKKYKKGLQITYGKDTSDSLGYLSLSLWAVCFIDYNKAIELAGSEEQLLQDLQKSDHYIVDVKPGTFDNLPALKRRGFPLWAFFVQNG